VHVLQEFEKQNTAHHMEVAFININCWYQSDKRPLVLYSGEGLPLFSGLLLHTTRLEARTTF